VEINSLKQQAAEKAVEHIESGMVVGLGHGSTAILAVHRLGELLRTKQLNDVICVPCSTKTESEARKLGIPMTTLEEHPEVDLTIDGADEVDPNLDLIKGGGGALLREKIVAQASRREIIIVDETKLSPVLGMKWPVPVEVIPFGWGSQVQFLESLGAKVNPRRNTGEVLFKTDQGNLILDCNFGPIPEPALLAYDLERRVGIVEHGMFLGLASEAIVAGEEGIRHLKRNSEG
jgi:ribose 5-phosphate isomerase A